jgi:hypothetical protein
MNDIRDFLSKIHTKQLELETKIDKAFKQKPKK